MWNAIVVIYSHSDFMWKIINLMLNSKYRKKHMANSIFDYEGSQAHFSCGLPQTFHIMRTSDQDIVL